MAMRLSPIQTVVWLTALACLGLTPILANNDGGWAGDGHGTEASTAPDGIYPGPNISPSVEVAPLVRLFAVEGRPFNFVFPQLSTATGGLVSHTIVTPLSGDLTRENWSFVPQSHDVGDHPFTLQIKLAGTLVEERRTRLTVSPKPPKRSRPVSFVLIGDSLTDGGQYGEWFAHLLEGGGSFMGTRAHSSGFKHEGRSGWDWVRYGTHINTADRADSSPFLDGHGELNIDGYLQRVNEAPQVLVWLLGTNDVFRSWGAVDLDITLDESLDHANRLTRAWRSASPGIVQAIVLTPSGNSRQEAFEANYNPPKDERLAWRRRHAEWLRRVLDLFENREREGLFVVPMHHSVDGTDGYPPGNALHPNGVGNRAMGEALYAWYAWLETSEYQHF